MLRKALANETDDGMRRALLDCLARRGDADAVGALLDDVEKGCTEEHVYAALGEVGDDAVARRLTAVAADRDRRYRRLVRGLAARALGAMAGAPDPRERISVDFPCRAYTAPIWEFMDWR